MIRTFMLCLVVQAQIYHSKGESSDISVANYSKVEDTFKLIELGERYLIFDEHRDVILLLGNTGSGKTTFAHFIAGDNSKMYSVETSEDSGDFIIIDENNKIGSGVDSKTIIPERVVDLDTDIVYYDCPGFSDTRNAAFDIASNYFIKQTIDHAKSVKMLFVISYSSMRVGVDRTDFMKLVRHIVEFVKNIEKFENGIGLIVTKVDNVYFKKGKNLVLQSDERVINNIADYIIKVKVSLEVKLGQTSDGDDKEFLRKSIALLNIFLRKKNDNYAYITLFRRPDENGVLTNVMLIQEGKNATKKMVETDISFIQKDKEDFDFSISDNSKNHINTLVEKIYEDTTGDISKTTADLRAYYEFERNALKDMAALNENMGKLYKNLLKTENDIKNSKTFKDFIVRFIKFITNLDISVSRQVFLSISKKYNYMEFLQLVSKKTYKALPAEWSQPLQIVLEHVKDLNIWYTFLVDLHDKLLTYERYRYLQVNPLVLNTQKTSVQLKEFLKLIANYNIMYFNEVKNMELDATKIMNLNSVINSLFQVRLTQFCSSPDTLVIKGNIIKFSNIPEKNPCTSQLKEIQIFATNVLFVDTDLIRPGMKLNLFAAAPTWEIIGDRKIVLDGTPGGRHPQSKAALAQAGKPGLPGGAAGNFIGIGQKIINSEHLTVSANGALGGPGQDGGNGLPGTDGVIELPRGSYGEGIKIMEKAKRYRSFDSNSWSNVKGLEHLGTIVGVSSKLKSDSYIVDGHDGTPGGDGFKAGAGGKGGLAGKISLFGFENHKISTQNWNGADGSPGKGGFGGQGGMAGRTHMCSYEKVIQKALFIEVKTTHLGWKCIAGASLSQSAGGRTSTEITSEGIKSPEPITPFSKPSQIVNSYKQYLLENVKNNINKRQVIKFYLYISNDLGVKEMYNSFDLLQELQVLEKVYFSLKDDASLLEFYECLLERIGDYAKNRKSFERNENYKVLLNYLYTATLSKIITIKNKPDGSLIIDMNQYFGLILNNIKKLEESTNEIIASEYNFNYKKGITEKINEATDFIENQIVKEIDDVTFQLESKIENLINEISSLSDQSEKERQNLMNKKAEMMSNIQKRISVENIKLVGTFARYFGPKGEALNDVIQITSKVQPELNINNIPPAKPLPQGVQTLLKEESLFVKNHIERKALALEHYLDAFMIEIKKYPHELGDLLTSTSEIKSELATAKQNMDASKILAVSDRMLTLLASKKDNSETVKNLLNTSKGTAKVAESLTDMYLLLRNDQLKLDQLSNAIQSQEKNINDLRKYQAEIYKTVVPMFNMLHFDITRYKDELTTNSRVALDVSKWKIQTYLKDMQIFLGKITSGFKVQDEMIRLVEKLDEALNTLIHIYDRIESYNEKKELADYIAGVNVIKSRSVMTSDSTINSALVNLDHIMKSNIIVAQFQKAMDGFKQVIFPFANYYLAEYQLPAQVSLERSVPNLIAQASHQIENINTKLNEHKILLHKDFDQYILVEVFQSGENYNGPFAVWDSYTYEHEISKLLSGKEVSLKADILTSIHEKNAIKFNKIGIRFKSKDKTIMKQLETSILSFDVSMTHSGNSYYRCGNRFYIINSENQLFYYSFEKNNEGEPVRKNQVYTKIKGGDYMLSPYTTWIIKLTPVGNANFNKLASFKGKVDLELIGHAQYVSAKNKVCGRNLKKYYRTVDTISVTDVMDDKYT